MYKLKLKKGRSYQGCGVKVDSKQSEIDVAAEVADRLLATGYFSLISAEEDPAEVNTPANIENANGGEGGVQEGIALDNMTVAQLKAFAKEHGIDISGLSKKPDILAKILEAGEEMTPENSSGDGDNNENNADESGTTSEDGENANEGEGDGDADDSISGENTTGEDGVIGSFIG